MDSYTRETLKREKVTIDRGQGPQEVEVTHNLYLPLIDQRTLETVGRGAHVGIGVRDERGFDLYCQREQVTR